MAEWLKAADCKFADSIYIGSNPIFFIIIKVMPQFDFYSFPEQNFFLLLSFGILYFFVVFFYLPAFAEVLKMRKKLLIHYSVQNLNNNNVDLISIFYGYLLDSSFDISQMNEVKTRKGFNFN